MSALMRPLRVVLSLLLACGLWLAAGRAGEGVPWQLLDSGMRPEAAGPAAPWQALDLHQLARWHGPYELRFRMQLPALADPRLVLRLALRGASESYWDDRLLGRNGVVGSSTATERPGRIDWLVALPAELAGPGLHELRIRASSQHLEPATMRHAEADIDLLPLATLAPLRLGPWLVAALAVGCLGLAWLYFALLAWRARHAGPNGPEARGAGLLLALGLVGLLLPAVEAWRPLLGYDYPLHLLRVRLVLLLTLLATLLLPACLAARWQAWPRPAVCWGFALALAAVALWVPNYDPAAALLHLSALLAGLLLAVRAWRQPGAGPDQRADAAALAALLGTTLLLALLQPLAFLDGLYFIALAVLMVQLLLGHATRLQALGERAARLEARQQRLQAQLLRNSIHPHWLMNTLTALQELIEAAPERASQLVERLGAEFQLLRSIGERPLIALAEEIELCRVHLGIVGLAREQVLELVVEGEPDGLALPPGVLHTLVENALTHGAPVAPEGFCVLRIRRGERQARLELQTLRGRGRSAGHGAGTGTRFVEASLEAAFPGAWQFRQGASGAYWTCSLLLPCRMPPAPPLPALAPTPCAS